MAGRRCPLATQPNCAPRLACCRASAVLLANCSWLSTGCRRRGRAMHAHPLLAAAARALRCNLLTPLTQGLNPYIRPLATLLGKLVPTAAIVATEKNTLYPNIQVGAAEAGGTAERGLLGWVACLLACAELAGSSAVACLPGGGVSPPRRALPGRPAPPPCTFLGRPQAQWDADPLVCHINTRVRNASEYLRITEQSMQARRHRQRGTQMRPCKPGSCAWQGEYTWETLIANAPIQPASASAPCPMVQRLGEADFPFIVFHSENDTMVDVDGSKALYLKAKASAALLNSDTCGAGGKKHWGRAGAGAK